MFSPHPSISLTVDLVPGRLPLILSFSHPLCEVVRPLVSSVRWVGFPRKMSLFFSVLLQLDVASHLLSMLVMGRVLFLHII